MKICHITTVHNRYDIRIFHKQCKSLSKDFDVSLIVADGLGDEIIDNIKIFDIGLRKSNRLKRAKIDSNKAYKKAISLECELYHFHDPELVKIGKKLKKNGNKVIYDAHEDLPRQIYSKPYLNKYIKFFVANLIEWQENEAAKQFDYIFTATPHICARFIKINPNSIDINNYPIIGELQNNITWDKKENIISYVGGISEIRGIKELIDAISLVSGISLHLAGEFGGELTYNLVSKKNGWKKVVECGFLSREDVRLLLGKSKAGIVTFLPEKNHINAQPNKLFEYMSAGIPVVASKFPLWQDIIEKYNCGICVDPMDPKEIAFAIEKIVKNDHMAREMGNNGKNAVLNHFNWKIEEEKLLSIYYKILY
ncbi:glycosyltransferase [bacterium]|nr:glycosyltransferase [bacterium]